MLCLIGVCASPGSISSTSKLICTTSVMFGFTEQSGNLSSRKAAFELTVSDLQKNSPNAQKKLKKALQLFEGFLSTGINGNVSQGMTLKTLDFLMENLEFSQKLTKTLAEICLFVNEDFSRDDISKGHKHLQQVLVSELLGQVVDEQVGTFWTCKPSRH